MAAFASTDVTYTIISQGRDSRGKKQNVVKLVFGDGALTYAAGGIPLDKAKMGCPNSVEAFCVFAGALGGYFPEYEYSTEKLGLMYGNYDSADGVLIEPTSVAIAAQTMHALVIGF